MPVLRCLAVLSFLAFANVAPAQQPAQGNELRAIEARAARVTIVRDRYGVPHVYAPTDAGVTLGIGYAQAEDNFWLLEEEYIRALGRQAELYGDSMTTRDAVRRSMDARGRAQAQYAKATPAFRAMMQGFADGVNLWIARNPSAPRLLRRWEPWYPFVFEQGGLFGGGAAPTPGALGLAPRGGDREPGAARADDTGEGALPGDEPPEGSNGWALAPARTTSGHAMLFINPHWQFFMQSQRWEVHVESGEGWRFSGFCILGNPIPRTGHNGRLGWTHTNLASDNDDVWSLAFDHPSDTLMYRHGAEWRRATPWTDTIVARDSAGTQRRVVHMLRTHLGPVFAWTTPQRALVVRTVSAELTASPLEQRYRMGRARSFAEWRRAMDLRTIAGSNTTYADAEGNILLAAGNASPKRAPGQDGRGILDGTDPATAWQGLHALDEIPHVLNPPGGFVQNTNSSIWLATSAAGNLDSAKYPRYMALDRDNARARSSRRLLDNERKLTFGEWARTTMDRRIHTADEELPALFAEAERMAPAWPGRTVMLKPLLDSLRAWDRTSDTSSVATTLFVQWDRERRMGRAADTAWARMAALERARDSLQAAWGRWAVRFGEVNRLQRVHPSGTQPFDTRRASWAVPNIDGAFGIIANMTATPAAAPILARSARNLATTARTRWGTAGNSYVAVVHFAPRVEARSLLTFGQSADSASKHHTDQATLFAGGEYKPAWFEPNEVQANAERAYHPGGRDLREIRVPGATRVRPRVASR